jgi:flagellar hook-length control protein FliK
VDNPQTEPVGNFVMTLAQSLQGGESKDAAVASASVDAPGASTDARSDADGKTAGAGPGELALALVSQALAAALGLPPVTPPMAAGPPGNAAAQPSNSSTATAAIDGNAAQSSVPGGSAMQTLVSLLAADAAAQSKDQNAPAATQSDATGTAAAGSSAPASVPDPGSAAAGPAMAHLGIASHFALQHPSADSNTLSGQLRSAVGTAAWQDELGGQISWMAHQGLESASLRLSPEHLGPLEVHISVRDGDASVWFGATQPDTRAALEQALPRLREMFATQGLTLSNSGVSHESPRNPSRPSPAPAIAAVGAVGAAETSASPLARLSLGLVDTYA